MDIDLASTLCAVFSQAWSQRHPTLIKTKRYPKSFNETGENRQWFVKNGEQPGVFWR